MKQMWKKIILLITVVALVLIGIGARNKMVKIDKMSEIRNQATKVLQEEVTKYIIENYEGITKIEWLGWKVNPMGTTSTWMIINNYPVHSVSDYFIYFVEDEYNIEKNNKTTDMVFTPVNTTDTMPFELQKQGVLKSTNGSSDVEIIYNWQENKGEW